MAGNRFTERLGMQDEFPNELNEQEFLVSLLKEEFPNDPVLEEGKLSPDQIITPLPVQGLAKRVPDTGLLEIDADVSASYSEYNINKLVPGIDDEELDEILDDEFEFYLDADDTGFRPPATTGLFLLSVEIDDRPFDFHDAYINSGPEQIPDLIVRGIDDDALLNSIFCVWFIERDLARPIPNYKTLEVMLAERSLTYGDIGEADEDQMKKFDMRLDGRFQNYPDEDVDGNELSQPTIFDEFIARSVLDRSKNWTTTTRFKTGYVPGDTFSGANFQRDPGDYIKPTELRSEATFIPELGKMVNARRARGIQQIREDDPGLGRTQLITAFNKFRDPLEDADPDDRYFDQAFITTRLEKLRAEYEGKLVLLKWPTEAFSIDVVRNFSDNVDSDDLIFDLRFMIHGHLKQVLSLRTLKEIARINGIDTRDYDPANELLPIGQIGTPEYQEAYDLLDEDQINALRERTGIINIMVDAGGIEVLGEQRSDTGTRAVWDDFGQIAQIDRLDFDEYNTYVTYDSNNLEPFAIRELAPYEPPGSIVYYPAIRYDELQAQSVAQGQFDQAVRVVKEMFPGVASQAAELTSRLSGIQGGFAQQCQDAFGPDSAIHQILFNTISNEGTQFIFYKQKNGGKLKTKGSEKSFFRLMEKEGRITRSFNADAENKIWLPGNDLNKAWHVNTNTVPDNDRGQALLATIDASGLQLCDDKMKEAMRKAKTGRTPQWKMSPSLATTADAQRQRYARPERDLSRVREQMKDGHYFRATVAQFILEFIIDPRKYQPNFDSLPEDLINGNDTADLYTLCIDAENFLADVRTDIQEISEFISTIDDRILQATTIEEIISIESQLRDGKYLVEDFNTELFTYLESIEAYINDERNALIKNIVKAIQYVRKKVNDKNDKYYIEWAPSNASIAAAFTSVDVEAYKPG